MSDNSLDKIDPCPACGALPCDWADDPHRLSTEAAIVAWLREQSGTAENEGRSIGLWEAADALQEKHRG